jgi:hypothetical protein
LALQSFQVGRCFGFGRDVSRAFYVPSAAIVVVDRQAGFFGDHCKLFGAYGGQEGTHSEQDEFLVAFSASLVQMVRYSLHLT